MRSLVTGATGCIGYEVARQLAAAEGVRSRFMVSRPERGRLLAQRDAEVVLGDLTRPASPAAALSRSPGGLGIASRLWTAFHEKRAAGWAMYTHPEFKGLADGGARPWEACGVLTEREMSAMMVWMTALLYNFKECMASLTRVFNIRWMMHLDPMLDRMEQLDESWEGGAVPFTRAFYYFVVPRSLGGDRKLAAGSFARAVELGPTRLVHRWGRARFFGVLTKDREGFVEDLEWVVTRDPETCSDAPPWKAYVQRDAKQLLERVDRLF